MARIAIDVRYLSHGLLGGVHTYTHNLVDALLRTQTRHDYVLWADSKSPFELSDLPANAELRVLPWHGQASSIRNDRLLGRAAFRAGTDVIHFPANYGSAPAWLPRVITLHDAINLLPISDILKGHSKDAKTIATMLYLHVATRRAIAGSPTVITVSEYSRREILKQTNLDESRVRVVYSAHEPAFRPTLVDYSARTRQRLGGREFMILADAIKNPECTLRAFRGLESALRERTALVFFSRRPPSQVVEESTKRGESHLLLRPSRDELVDLYSAANVFVFPSLYEGFGIPVLESMACGTPVIASNRGALPEIVGSAGILVDADDHRALAAGVSQVLLCGGMADHLRAASIERASRFSWETTAGDVATVYEEVAHSAVTKRASSARLATV